MIEYGLGVITGIILLAACLVYKTPIERAITQTTSRVARKGAIIDNEPDEVKDWVSSLKSDEEMP